MWQFDPTLQHICGFKFTLNRALSCTPFHFFNYGTTWLTQHNQSSLQNCINNFYVIINFTSPIEDQILNYWTHHKH